jgi:hypothetical protein
LRYKNANENVYLITKPTRQQEYIAEQLYDDTIEDNKFSNLYTIEQILKVLLFYKFIPLDYEKRLKTLSKKADDAKITLYEAMIVVNDSEKEKQIKKSRRRLSDVNRKYNRLSENIHSLDYVTLEGYAQTIKSQYLTLCSLKTLDNKQVFVDQNPETIINNIQASLLFSNVVNYINYTKISMHDLRVVSQHEPWRSYWGANKQNVFGRPSIEWTDDQRLLVLFTRMYDGAYESMNCPGKAVFDDDDAFDGWMVKEQRDREKDRNKKQIDDSLDKHGSAEEIFIPAANLKQAKQIDEMNTVESKMIKKSKFKAVAELGKVKEQDLPDRKQQRQMQAVNQYRDKVTKNK